MELNSNKDAELYRQNISDAELQWLERIYSIKPIVEGWFETPPWRISIEQGSSLKGDEIDWLQPGLTAEYLMGIATEHIRFCARSLLSGEAITPTVHITLGRTALMTASTAVWILSPPKRQQRRINTWILKNEEVRNEIAALRELRDSSSQNKEEVDAALDFLLQKQSKLKGIAENISLGEFDFSQTRFNQTAVIREAITSLPLSISEDENESAQLQTAMRMTWRTASAAAHGYYSHRLRSAELPSNDSDPLLRGKSLQTAHIDKDVGPLVITAYFLLKYAIELRKSRGKNHINIGKN